MKFKIIDTKKFKKNVEVLENKNIYINVESLYIRNQILYGYIHNDSDKKIDNAFIEISYKNKENILWKHKYLINDLPKHCGKPFKEFVGDEIKVIDLKILGEVKGEWEEVCYICDQKSITRKN